MKFKYNTSLDSIRGLAILMVVISHLCTNSYIYGLKDYKMLGNYDMSFAFLADGGVLLFFYLSGFLIYQSLQGEDLKTFIIKRFLRIFPPYWISIFTVFIVSILFSFIPHYDLQSYIINFFMLQDILRTQTQALNGVFWSLLIEIKFYIFIGVMFYFFMKKENTLVYVYLNVLIVGLLLYFLKSNTPSAFFTWFPSFFIGIFIFLYYHKHFSLYKLFYLISVYAIYLFIIKGFQELLLYSIFNSVLFLLFLRFNISSKVFNFFGKISYSLYLLHTTISYPLLYLMTKYISPYFIFFKIIVAFFISIALSYISYIYIENIHKDYVNWKFKCKN